MWVRSTPTPHRAEQGAWGRISCGLLPVVLTISCSEETLHTRFMATPTEERFLLALAWINDLLVLLFHTRSLTSKGVSPCSILANPRSLKSKHVS
jgi:hypothetical protein